MLSFLLLLLLFVCLFICLFFMSPLSFFQEIKCEMEIFFQYSSILSIFKYFGEVISASHLDFCRPDNYFAQVLWANTQHDTVDSLHFFERANQMALFNDLTSHRILIRKHVQLFITTMYKILYIKTLSYHSNFKAVFTYSIAYSL